MLSVQGPVYQVFFRWKTQDDITEELLWDWDQLLDTDLVDQAASSCVFDANRMLKKKNLLLLVAGEDHKNPKFMDMKELLVHIPQKKEDIKICPKVQDKIDKGFEIHSGRGRMLLDDRMYVRAILEKINSDSTLSYILKECIVYAPVDFLEGLEWIDAPGSGTTCPLEKVYYIFFRWYFGDYFCFCGV